MSGIFYLLTLYTKEDFITLTLIAPYAVLPNHFCYFYIFNWLPWEVAFIIAGLTFCTQQYKSLPLNVILSLFALTIIAITYPHRNSSALMYEKEESINRNIISTLQRNHALLNKEKLVGIAGKGAQGFSPWAISQGEYLQAELKLTPQWILFSENPSINTQSQFNPNLRINTLSYQKIKEFTHLKIIYFDANGRGVIP
jgi:hypothetical protein